MDVSVYLFLMVLDWTASSRAARSEAFRRWIPAPKKGFCTDLPLGFTAWRHFLLALGLILFSGVDSPR